MSKKLGGLGLNGIKLKWIIGTHGNWKKIKILGAVLELPARQHCQSSPFILKNGPNWPNWRCRLAGSSKMAPRISIFSIVLGAEYSFYVKSNVPQFFGYNNSVLAIASTSARLSWVPIIHSPRFYVISNVPHFSWLSLIQAFWGKFIMPS